MIRIAASIYLNSAPLVYSFSEGSRRRTTRFLGDKAPSRCAQMLEAGLCDAALIPVIEYQRIPDLVDSPAGLSRFQETGGKRTSRNEALHLPRFVG